MAAIATRCYALVVLRQGGKFALVQESDTKHWYLPAGRVEGGESFFEAARRETLEEAGVDVELDGIVRVEHTPAPDGTARLRVIFLGHALNDAAKLKDFADEHSVQARWFTLDEARTLQLRGTEIIETLRYVERGGPVQPLWLLTTEQAPYRE